MKKIILIIILLVLAFVVKKRWNAWFGNPVEPSYQCISEPGRIQLTFGNDGEFSRNISWQCGDTVKPSQALIVQTGTTDTIHISAFGKIFHTTGGTSVCYHTKLNNLIKDATYTYSVKTGNQFSNWYSFSMKDRTKQNFSFIYLGDIQDTIHGVTKNFFTNIHKRHNDADFWVLGGDVIERPQDRYWNEYYQSMDSISQTKPIIACPGNHEYLKGITRTLEERFIYNFSYFIDSKYKGHTVFDIEYGNTAIITLDSNKDPWTLFSQREWFENALKQAKNAKWKIVVLHHPIYSIKGKMNNLTTRIMFASLIEKYGVDIVLEGHEHAYARMTTKTENNELATPIYIISQSSPKDYRISFNKKYDRFGSSKRFYQVLDVSKDSLYVKTYTEDSQLYDNICVIKNGDGTKVEDFSKNIPETIGISNRMRTMKKDDAEEYKEDIKKRLFK